MGQQQQEIAAGGALRRMIVVLTVAALMAVMLVTMVAPAFAAPVLPEQAIAGLRTADEASGGHAFIGLR